jgi:ribonuclease T2
MHCNLKPRLAAVGEATPMRLTVRTALVVMLAFAALLGAAEGRTRAKNHARGEPGKFDFYVLTLSWSPSFCETPAGSRSKEQCGARPFSFVVHGLWPQYEKGYPESCEVPPPRLARTIVDGMLDLMPARGLIYHEWDAHGTCSGLDQRDYFDTIRKAREQVKIPAQFDQPQQPLNIAPDDLVDAFVKANAGLTPAAITIDCDRMRLREVRICMTRELTFRDCGSDKGRVCRSDSLVMPPVRGQ